MSLKIKVLDYKFALNEHIKKLRRYDPEDLVVACANTFRKVGNDPNRVKYYPHNDIYCLLKYAIIKSENPYATPKELNDKEFKTLVENQKNLYSPILNIGMASDDPLELAIAFLGNSAQFPFQDVISKVTISRSLLLYETEESSKNIDKLFQKVTGISIRSFAQGCLALWVLAENNLFIKGSISGISLDVFAEPQWSKFLPLVRVDFEGFRALCKQNDFTSFLYERFSLPVLLKAPVLQLSEGNIVPWPMFLLDRLCFGPYDILKEQYGSDFTETFGIAFENYVKRVLDIFSEETGIAYYKESQSFGEGKTPDFYIPFEEESVLLCVEVKANRGKAFFEKREAIRYMDQIVGKGIAQSHAIWERARNGEETIISSSLKNCIPIIVTLSHFNFPNGQFYRDSLLREQKGITGNETLQMCIDNYQVMDIGDFEILINTCVSSKLSLIDIVRKKIVEAREDNWREFLSNDSNEESEIFPEIIAEYYNLFDELIKGAQEAANLKI